MRRHIGNKHPDHTALTYSSNPSPFYKGGTDFLKFDNKGGNETFFLEREGVGLKGGIEFSKSFSKSFFKIPKHKIRALFLLIGTNMHILNLNIGYYRLD